MRGRSRQLSYLPGGEALFLTGDVTGRGAMAPARQYPRKSHRGSWKPSDCVTSLERRRGSQPMPSELVSSDGTLTGERLDLWLSNRRMAGSRRLVSTTGAALRVALGSSEGPGVPATEASQDSRRRSNRAGTGRGWLRGGAPGLLATGNARLFREGIARGANRSPSRRKHRMVPRRALAGAQSFASWRRHRCRRFAGARQSGSSGAAGLNCVSPRCELSTSSEMWKSGTAFASRALSRGPRGRPSVRTADFLSGGRSPMSSCAARRGHRR